MALIPPAAFVASETAIAPGNDAAITVYAVAIVTYVALAIVSLFTGFRVAFLPFRMCPFVLCTSAALIAVGAFAQAEGNVLAGPVAHIAASAAYIRGTSARLRPQSRGLK